jgi:guanyl-specific ribonuclease Sa
VNDFLSGAAPLNLTMRLGDHMMLIQLQLSTVNNQMSNSSRHHHHHISSSSSRSSSSRSSSSTASSHYPSTSSGQNLPQQQQKVRLPLLSPGGLYTAPPGYPSAAVAGSSHVRMPEAEAGPPLAKRPKLDTRALAEASKNLTQTLKQLSSEVLITRPEAGGQQAHPQQHQQQAAGACYAESTPRPRKEVGFLLDNLSILVII